MNKMAAKQKSLKVQLIQYFVSGGAFFWSGYVAFAVFDSVLHWPLFIAKQLANVIGLTINYVLEDRWVFNAKKRAKLHNRRTGRYILITVVNFGIDYLIVSTLKNHGISPYLGQFASAGFFTVWNFAWYKYWVFAPHTPKRIKKVR
jgi:putative flippase GtrA